MATVSIYDPKDHKWREQYNPLRGMNLVHLMNLLEAGERGAYSSLQWFYHYMERSDAMIHGVIQRRKAALMGCDWDVRQVPVGTAGDHRRQTTDHRPGDRVLAEEQAAFLREAYDRVENFRDAVSFLFSGVFRGYAHLEKQFEASGLVSRLEPVDQWFWVRDGMYGAWEYNHNAVSGRTRGVPIELENFVVMETVAINRMLAVLYLRKNLSQKDWDSFLEVYGIPSVFLVGPANVPESKEADYQKIAQEIISDGRGYLPFGSDVKYVNGGGNRPPFMEHIEYIDRQITLAATGGLLTMLTQSGSGTLAGGAHQETFLQIARGDAAMLSGIFQEQFDTPLLRQFFPGEPILAYFEFVPPAADEVSRVIQDAVELAKAGVRMETGELSEKTGYTLESVRPAPVGEMTGSLAGNR
jgi:phage gp29-like protein